MSAAAVIGIRRKRLVRVFHEAGATDSSRAVTLAQLGQRRSWIFEQMVRHGVFTAVAGERYFMHPELAAKFLAAHRRRALVFTGAFLLLILLAWLLNLLVKALN